MVPEHLALRGACQTRSPVHEMSGAVLPLRSAAKQEMANTEGRMDRQMESVGLVHRIACKMSARPPLVLTTLLGR